MRHLVVRKEGKLGAFASYELMVNEGGKPVSYLYELQLDDSVRGGKPSLGKALIAEVEERAAESGSGRLQLSCAERNTAAVGFYTKGCGYEQIGSRMEQDDDGEKHRILVFEKVCALPEEEGAQGQGEEQRDADPELDENEE